MAVDRLLSFEQLRNLYNEVDSNLYIGGNRSIRGFDLSFRKASLNSILALRDKVKVVKMDAFVIVNKIDKEEALAAYVDIDRLRIIILSTIGFKMKADEANLDFYAHKSKLDTIFPEGIALTSIDLRNIDTSECATINGLLDQTYQSVIIKNLKCIKINDGAIKRLVAINIEPLCIDNYTEYYEDVQSIISRYDDEVTKEKIAEAFYSNLEFYHKAGGTGVTGVTSVTGGACGTGNSSGTLEISPETIYKINEFNRFRLTSSGNDIVFRNIKTTNKLTLRVATFDRSNNIILDNCNLSIQPSMMLIPGRGNGTNSTCGIDDKRTYDFTMWGILLQKIKVNKIIIKDTELTLNGIPDDDNKYITYSTLRHLIKWSKSNTPGFNIRSIEFRMEYMSNICATGGLEVMNSKIKLNMTAQEIYDALCNYPTKNSKRDTGFLPNIQWENSEFIVDPDVMRQLSQMLNHDIPSDTAYLTSIEYFTKLFNVQLKK